MVISEAQQLVRDTARDFARQRIAPQARQWEAEGAIPRDVLAEMADIQRLVIGRELSR